ncbi:MAG TPA: protein kinase [Caulobacteraceae bacterium]
MRLVGRYEVGERIGEGAMADVYRAFDPRINRVLAIKILKQGYRQNRQYTARFLREAKAAGALSHPNIVTIYDVGEVDGYPYIAMELLEGSPLDTISSGSDGLPTQRVLQIGLQLAEALRYAHGLGIVHRDIKPSNIMLGTDGSSVKLLDFGIARITDPGVRDHDLESLETQVGQVIGTPRYMSPEQALGQEIDGRSDLFSVGAVLYELITGRRAFSASSPFSLALQIAQQDPPPITSFAGECPKGLIFIVEKLLSKRPERRFSSGERLAEALRKELSAISVASGETSGASWRLPIQARVMLIMALVTALGLLASTGAVLDQQFRAMRRMDLTSGSTITAFVANNAALRAADNATLPASERDWLPLQAFVRAASADPNVAGMTVVDADGLIEAASDPSLLGRRYRAAVGERLVARESQTLITSRTTPAGRPAFRFVRPITYAGHVFGKVDVSLDASALRSAALLSRLLLLGLGALMLVVVMASSYAAARQFAMPIRRLKAALDEACEGNHDFRISHKRKDEFGELFDAFNRLTGAMQEASDRAPSAAIGQSAVEPAPPPPSAPQRSVDPTCIETPGQSRLPVAQLWRERWAKVASNSSARRIAAAPVRNS